MSLLSKPRLIFIISTIILLIFVTSSFLANPFEVMDQLLKYLFPVAICTLLGDITSNAIKVLDAVTDVVIIPGLHQCLPQL